MAQDPDEEFDPFAVANVEESQAYVPPVDTAAIPVTPPVEAPAPAPAEPDTFATSEPAFPVEQPPAPIQVAPTPDISQAGNPAEQTIDEPVIAHRRFSEDRLEARQQIRDQVQGQREQREAQSEEKKRATIAQKILKQQGVELEVGPDGQPRPRVDAQGRTLFKPEIIAPFEQNEKGMFSRRRNRLGEEELVPLNPKIDPATGEKYVIGEDGKSRVSMGIDEGFVTKKQATVTGQQATVTKQQLAEITRQEKAVRERIEAATTEASMLSTKKNLSEAERIRLAQIQKDNARDGAELTKLGGQKAPFEEQAKTATAAHLQARSAVLAHEAKRWGVKEPGAAQEVEKIIAAESPEVVLPVIQDAAKTASAGVTTGAKFYNALGALVRGVADIPASVMDTAGILAIKLDRALPAWTREIPGFGGYASQGVFSPKETVAGQIAGGLRNIAEGMFPENKALQDDFVFNKVPQGLGSALGFMSGGLLAKSKYIVPAALGSTVGFAAGYDDAIQHGASEDDAMKAALLNGGVGLSEVVPIGGMLNRWERATGGTFKKQFVNFIRNGAFESVEEAAQEFFQTTAGNAIAKSIYDGDRELFEGAGEGAAVGGVSGFLLSTIVSAATGGKLKLRERSENKRTVEAFNEENKDREGFVPLAPKDAPILKAAFTAAYPETMGKEWTAIGDEMIRLSAAIGDGKATPEQAQALSDLEARQDAITAQIQANNETALGAVAEVQQAEPAMKRKLVGMLQGTPTAEDIDSIRQTAPKVAAVLDLKTQPTTPNAQPGRPVQNENQTVPAGQKGKEGAQNANAKPGKTDPLVGEENVAPTLNPQIAADAKALGLVYQGEANGLHAFKDEKTGGNFSIPTDQLSRAAIEQKAKADRAAFEAGKIGVGDATTEDVDKAIAEAQAKAAGDKAGTSATGTSGGTPAETAQPPVPDPKKQGETPTPAGDSAPVSTPTQPGQPTAAQSSIPPATSATPGAVQPAGTPPPAPASPASASTSPTESGQTQGGTTAQGEKQEEASGGDSEKRSSTQVNLPPDAAKALVTFGQTIDPADLYNGEEGTDSFGPEYGLETEPHITALYGLTGQDAEEVRKIVADFGPITATLGKVTLFENDDRPYDVVKFDIESPDLHRLNAKLKELPFTSDFPDYHPHATIAYVKKGTGKKYVGAKSGLTGRTITFDTLKFSNADRVKTDIPLTEKQPVTASQGESRARALVAKSLKANRNKAVLDALQVSIDTASNLPASFRATFAPVETANGPDYALHVNLARIEEKTAGLSDEKAEEFIETAIGEEVKHFAQFEAVRKAWSARGKQDESGKRESFQLAFRREYGGVEAAMNITQRKAAFTAYTGRDLDDKKADSGDYSYEEDGKTVRIEKEALGAEFVRQLIQKGTGGQITEATIRAKPIIDRLLAVLKELLDRISIQNAPKALQRAYDQTKAVLAEIEAGQKPSSTPSPETGGTGAAPSAITGETPAAPAKGATKTDSELRAEFDAWAYGGEDQGFPGGREPNPRMATLALWLEQNYPGTESRVEEIWKVLPQAKDVAKADKPAKTKKPIEMNRPPPGGWKDSDKVPKPAAKPPTKKAAPKIDAAADKALDDAFEGLDSAEPRLNPYGEELPEPEFERVGQIRLWHGSQNRAFNKFDPDAIRHFGFHFGTEEQAARFGKPRQFTVTIENALRVKDLGQWHFEMVASELRDRDLLTTEEYERAWKQFDQSGELRKILLEKGIDGFVYENEVEGEGDSYVAFRPDQISRPIPANRRGKNQFELYAAEPQPITQAELPPDKIGAFVNAAQNLIRLKITTPEGMAAILDEKFQGRYRKYSEALWDAFGMANKSLRGTHDWTSIYDTLDNAQSETTEEETKEDGGDALANIIRDKLLSGENLDRRALTSLVPEGMSAKDADEQAELGIVLAGRQMIEDGRDKDAAALFDSMLDLYNRQPNLTAKTSTSKVAQAYSTPIPLGFLASRLAQIDKTHVVQEDTAGNGMLLIEADQGKALVNELNPKRADNLRNQGFSVREGDATSLKWDKKSDRLNMNPPFGKMKDEGIARTWPLEGTDKTTSEIDHAISLHSLANLKDDGRAVLIIGGTQTIDPTARRQHYGQGDRGEFFSALYAQYKVIDHFTVDGDLYRKQGAGWPVDVIVIAGRGASPIQLPTAQPPRILKTWDELRSEITRPDEDRIQAGKYDEARDRDDVIRSIAGIRDALTGSQRPGGTGNNPQPAPQANAGAGNESAGIDVGTESGSDTGTEVQDAATGAPGGMGDGRSERDSDGRIDELEKEAAKTDEEKPQFHKPYVPVSEGNSFGIETPANLAEPQRLALEAIEKSVGKPLREYVREKLGYGKDAPIDKYFAAEQLDAIASAIYNIENGGALILGDMTGVGKGRVVAALIEYAKRMGMTPVFVTKNPTLYAAMLGDFHNIGRTIQPLYTNNDLSITHPKTGADIRTKVQKPFFDEIERTGKLPEKFDAVFTTYDQIGKINDPAQSKESRRQAVASGGAPMPGPAVRALLRLAAGTGEVTSPRGKALILLDESHLGAGASSQGIRVRQLIQNARVYYSSATFAKRPDAMPLYFKTNLRLAAPDVNQLMAVFAGGGVVMQQITSQMLAQDGQYIRRERTFDGVPFETRINFETEERDRALANEYTRGLRTILEMSNRIEAATDSMNAILARMGRRMQVPVIKMESADFASQIHNFVKQYLFAIKAEAAAQQAIQAIKEGHTTKDGTVKRHKVIVAVENTMEGPIRALSDAGLPLQFTSLLKKTLEGLRKIKTGGSVMRGTATYFTVRREPAEQFRNMSQDDLIAQMITVKTVMGADGPTQVGMVNERVAEEVFRRLANSQFLAAEEELDQLELGDMPLSPIDYIRQRAEAVGIVTGEITGRSTGIDKNGKTYNRDTSDISKKGQLETLRRFNETDLNLMVINASGSTGVSAHADENFANKAPRMMIVAQPHLDINEFMQTLGRIFRSGQVELPRYQLLQTALPAEKRPAAILGKKMASLNANTTSNADSQVSSEANVVDIFNEYGDGVVWTFLRENPHFVRALQWDKITAGPNQTLRPLSDIMDDLEEDGKLARGASSYASILSVEEQDVFWEDVINRYKAQITYLDQIGENKLKASAEDLGAEMVKREVLTPGNPNGKSAFDAPSYIETVNVRPKILPMEPAEVRKLAEEAEQTKAGIIRDYRKTSSEWSEAYLEKRKEKAIGDWSTIGPRERERLQGQYNAVFGQIQKLGKLVQVQTASGQKIGAVIAVEIDPESPLTPSKQMFTIALNTLRRTIKIPGSQMPESVSEMDETEFEDRYNATREDKAQRQIITGNLIAASVAVRGQGAVAKFTRADGSTETGILLPISFNVNALNSEQVQDPAQAQQLLRDGVDITADDGRVRLFLNNGTVMLSVPSSRAAGGRYWQDQRLTGAMKDGEMIQRGQAMVGEVTDLNTVIALFRNTFNQPLSFSRDANGGTTGAGLDSPEPNTIPDWSETKTVKQALEKIAASPARFNEVASALLEKADPLGLSAGVTIVPGRAVYRTSIHKIQIEKGDSPKTVLHESMHALTVRNIEQEVGARTKDKHGSAYVAMLRKAREDAATSDGMKELIDVYFEAIDKMGYSSVLTPSSESAKVTKNFRYGVQTVTRNRRESEKEEKHFPVERFDIHPSTAEDARPLRRLLDKSGIEYQYYDPGTGYGKTIKINADQKPKLEEAGLIDRRDTPNAFYPFILEFKVAGRTGVKRAKIGDADVTVDNGAPYGLGNLYEFVAEAFSSYDFQRRLSQIKGSGKRSLWQRLVDAVAKSLGIYSDKVPGSLLEDVIRISGEIAQRPTPEKSGGKDLNLNAPEPSAATETPAFKRWFGESKVVDEDGNPMVVYHTSSSKEPFTEFQYAKLFGGEDRYKKTGKKGGLTFAMEGLSTGWFTSSEKQFKSWKTEGDGNVIQAYVKIENPLILEAEPFAQQKSLEEKKRLAEIQKRLKAKEEGGEYIEWQEFDKLRAEQKELEKTYRSSPMKEARVLEIDEQLNAPYTPTKKLREIKAELKKLVSRVGTAQEIRARRNEAKYADPFYQLDSLSRMAEMDFPDLVPGAALRKALIRDGYDGVILKGTNADHALGDDSLAIWVIPLHGGAQIKSATANSGEFNPETGNFLQSSEPGGTPEEKPQASQSVEILKSALSELPPVERKVLSMRSRGETDEAIAAATGLSMVGVERAYRVALGKMRLARERAERVGETFKRVLSEKEGERTLGRPDLANPGRGPMTRRMVDTVDVIREEDGIPVKREDAAVIEESTERLNTPAKYKKERERLFQMSLTGELLNDVDTAMAKRIVNREALRAIKTGDANRIYEAASFINAYRVSGTEAARAFRQRRDWTKSPAERLQEYVAQAILTPPKKMRDRLDDTKNNKERERILRDWVRQMNRLKKQLKHLGLDLENMTDEEIQAWLSNKTRATRAVRAIQAAKADAWDALYEYWIASILSSPTTQVANLIGNFGNSAWDFTAQRLTEAMVNLAVGDPNSAQLGEFAPMMRAIMPGLQRASRNFLQAWRTETPVFEEEVTGDEGTTKLEEMGREPAIEGARGRFIRTPLRLLLAVDEFSKSLIGQMQAAAVAYRISKEEGLSGAAQRSRIDALMAPGSVAWQEAVDKSKELAFQQEMGRLGKAVLLARTGTPGLRYFIPFVTTIANIFKTAVRKTPLGSVALLYRMSRQGAVSLDWDGSGYRYTKKEFVPHAAEQLLAWSIFFALRALVEPDEEDEMPILTGTTPYQFSQRGARDLAYRTAPPMSIRIGGEWYSYARIEPFATALGIMADGLKKLRETKNGKEHTAALGELMQHLTAQVKDKTFARGIGDILNALEDGASVTEWAGNFATSWVPNIIRATARETDDAVREQKLWGRGEEWGDRLKDRLIYKTLPIEKNAPEPKVDLWGREIQKDKHAPGTDLLWRMLFPARTQPGDTVLDVDRMILRWNNENPNEKFAPQAPAPKWDKTVKQADGTKKEVQVYMTDREYNDFLQMAGKGAAERLKSAGLNYEKPTKADLEKIDDALAKSRKAARDVLWTARVTRALGNPLATKPGTKAGE